MHRKLIILAMLLLIPTALYGQITDDKPHKSIEDADIVDSVHFSSDTVYVLDKLVFVENGEILTIDPGTVIKSDTGSNDSISALIVARGGYIYAPGSKAEPIIFTSILDDLDSPTDLPLDTTGRGKWGGVIILGQAVINTTSATNQLPFLPLWETRDEYGGSVDDDSSGVLQFISIRHAGSQCQGIEMPGLTLAGVGSRTVIDHIEVIHGKGDGFNFLGGMPRCKFMVAAFCCDEGFDSNEGFRGFGQYWFTIMPEAYDGGHHAAEHKGGTDPEDGTPYAIPTIVNATYIGCGSSAPNPNVCLRFDDNGGGNYYNSIFTDHSQYGIAIEDNDASYPSTECTPSYYEDSEKRLVCSDIDIQSNLWWDFGNGNSVTDIAPQQYSRDIVFGGLNNNDITDPEITRIDRTAGARLLNPNPVMGGISDGTADTLLLPDPWFDRVDFMGAFYPYMAFWTDDWSGLDFYGYTEKITFSTYIGTIDSSAFLPLPIYENLMRGTRFYSPSLFDTLDFTKLIFLMYKVPGTAYNPDNDIQVRLYTENEFFLPDSMITETYVLGSDLAGSWSIADSVYEVLVEFSEPDLPQIEPGRSYFATFKSATGDTVKLVTSIYDPCGVKAPVPGPCDPKDPFKNIFSDDGGFTFDHENDHVIEPAVNYELGGSNSFFDEHVFNIVLQYFGRILRGYPFSNRITVYPDAVTFYRMILSEIEDVYSIHLVEKRYQSPDPMDYVEDRDDFISPSLQSSGILVYYEVYDEDMHDHTMNSSNYYYVMINGGNVYYNDQYNYFRPSFMDNLDPWLDVESMSLSDVESTPDGVYHIDLVAPPADVYYDNNFIIGDYSLRFKFDLDLEFSESIHMMGDPYQLIPMPHSKMNAILFNDVIDEFSIKYEDYTYFEDPLGELEIIFDDQEEYKLVNDVVFSGPMFVLYLPFAALEISADIGTEATMQVTGGLSTVTSMNTQILPQIHSYSSTRTQFNTGFTNLVVHTDDESSYSFQININDTEPVLTSNHCFDVKSSWRVYNRILWHIERYGDTETLLYDCPKGEKISDEDVIAENQLSREIVDAYIETPSMSTSYDASALIAAYPHLESENKSEIHFSIHDGNQWSEPQAATNTSHAKTDIDVTALGSDGFAAIWVEQNEFDTTGFDFETGYFDLFKSQDIVTSQYNATTETWNTPVRLTDDNKADGCPAIAGNQSGIIYAAWVHHENTVSFSVTNSRIYYAIFNGSTWGSPVEIPGQSGFNLEPDLTLDPASGNAIMIWIDDLDGIIKTFGDRNINLVEVDPSGTIVNQEVVLALDGPLSPSVAVSDNGDIVVGYERWGEMIVHDAYGSHTDTVGLGHNIKIAASIDRGSGWQTYAVGDVDTAGYGANPRVLVNNLTDSAYIVAQGFEKGDTMRYDGEIIASSISLTDDPGQWGKPEFLIYDTIYNLMGDAGFDPGGQLRILYLADVPTTVTFPTGLDQIYEILPRETCCDTPGDANNDGTCNIGDEVFLGNFVFRSGQCDDPPGNPVGCPPECLAEGDANADGGVNIGDEVFLGNYIFRPPPVSPFPECGPE